MGQDVPDEEIQEAQDNADRAKDEVADWRDKYNNLSGNTVGVRFANRVIREGKVFTNRGHRQTRRSPRRRCQRKNRKSPSDRIWNTMTPAQRAQANPTPETQAKAAEANQAGAPAAKPHQTPAESRGSGFHLHL